MKKGNIEGWMWVIGGILIGLLILGISTLYIANLLKDKSAKDMINQFDFLKTRIDMMCYQYPGSKTEDLSLYIAPTFRKLYVTTYQEYQKHQTNKEHSMQILEEGDVICLEYGKSFPVQRCYKLKCNASFSPIDVMQNTFLKQLLSDPDIKVVYIASIEKTPDNVKIEFKLTK